MISQEEHQEVLARFKSYRNKALVGYAILLIGVGASIGGVVRALDDSKARGGVVRGIICNILRESDEEGIRQLPLEAKLLKIDQSQLEKFLAPNLKKTAEYRHELEPSSPASACDGEPIKLPSQEHA